jgi:hypothetical protein
MDFSDFQRLISTFRNSVPNYTVSWEFRRADKNQDGKISMAEFLQSAERIMEVSKGGDKALGSASHRCCCSKVKPVNSEYICVDKDTLQVYTESMGQHFGKLWSSNLTIRQSGQTCKRACTSSIEKTGMAGVGNASSYQPSAQGMSSGGSGVIFGSGIYSPAKSQTYQKCVDKQCSKNVRRVTRNKKRKTICSSRDSCLRSATLSYCGHTNLKTNLVRFQKIGAAGKCVKEAALRNNIVKRQKKCPQGDYHRSRFWQSHLSFCDCNDECP